VAKQRQTGPEWHVLVPIDTPAARMPGSEGRRYDMITSHRLTAVVASFMLVALAVATAPAALAQPPDPPDGTGQYLPPQPPTRVVHDGTSLWVFGLVAAVAVCLTVAAILTIQAQQHRRLTPAARTKHT
jgi:hypothetical protein